MYNTFDLINKLKLFSSMKKPMVVEVRYGYTASGNVSCPGYWDSLLNWHESQFNHEGWIIAELLKAYKN